MPTTIACKTCGQVHQLDPLPPGTVAHCRRCGSVIERRTFHSLHRTAAFSLAALILYIPANTFPILHMDLFGSSSDNTVWQGVVLLVQDGQWIVAAIVFMASIFIPLLKLLGLLFLVASSAFHWTGGKMMRTWAFRIIEGIGRWAMLDVFVLAVLVSLVKLKRLATIIPGPGLTAFAFVVVCTLLASASFDPQLIWEKEEHVR
jgi:paraquat-inducible protein A